MTVDIDSVRMLTDSIKAATERKPDGSTVSATVTEAGSNIIWVRIDGSNGTTPVTESTVSVAVGDRVSVRIENGSATITGNLSNVSTGAAETRAAVEPVKAVAESAEQAAERATDYASTAKNAAQSAVQSAADAGRAAAVAQAAMGSTTVDWHDYTVNVGEDGQWHVFDKNGAEVPLSEISMVYQDALGLHVLGDDTRLDVGSDAVEIFDSANDGRRVASFGAETVLGDTESGYARFSSSGFDVKSILPGGEWSSDGVFWSGQYICYTADGPTIVKFDGIGNNWVTQVIVITRGASESSAVIVRTLPNGPVVGNVSWTYGPLKAGQTIEVLCSGPMFDTATLEHSTIATTAANLEYSDGQIRIGRESAETSEGTGMFASRAGIQEGFNRKVGFIVGSGGKNAGVWDVNLNKWLIYSNGSTDRTLLHGGNASVDDSGIYSGLKGSAIITESISLFSSVSIAAGGYESGTVNLASKHSGYKPIAVVGQYVNSRYVGFGQAYIDDDGVLHYLVHNNTSSARSTTASVRVMFVR